MTTARLASSSSVRATTASQDGVVRARRRRGARGRGHRRPARARRRGRSPARGRRSARSPVEDDEPPAERVERVPEQLPGAPVAGDQQERLAQPRHLAAEVLQRQRRRKARSCSRASSEPIA